MKIVIFFTTILYEKKQKSCICDRLQAGGGNVVFCMQQCTVKTCLLQFYCTCNIIIGKLFL